MSVVLLIGLIILWIGWLFSCYFVAYSNLMIGLKNGDDINLNKASKALWYASMSSWIPLLIVIIIIIVAIIFAIIIALFAPEVVAGVYKFFIKYFKSTFLSKGKSGLAKKSFIIFTWILLVLAVILTSITGFFAGQAAYYINYGVYSEADAETIQKCLLYCYITACLSILLIVILILCAFLYIYFTYKAKKIKKSNDKIDEIKKEKKKKEKLRDKENNKPVVIYYQQPNIQSLPYLLPS